jgi:hypothetical protein
MVFGALPQKSIGVVTSFVFSSCDFVDRSFCPEKQGRSTKSHEPTRTKYFRLELDVTFEAKLVFGLENLGLRAV